MSEPRFVVARGPWRLLLKTCGLIGIVMPWRTVYCHPDHIEDPELRRHELIHIAQIDRDGAILFSLRYLWWLVRYGYRANPYEIEAYGSAP